MSEQPVYRMLKTLWCKVSPQERDEILALKAQLGVDTMSNLFRQALFTLADEAGIAINLELRGPTGRRHARFGRLVPVLQLDDEDRSAANQMMAMCGIASEADLMRLGLWHLGRHLDLRLPASCFAIRGGQRTPKVSAARTSEPSPARPQTPRGSRLKPGADHPWRGRKVSA